ncbi:TPA: acryloyl-CoA reductase [Streptococcus suis]
MDKFKALYIEEAEGQVQTQVKEIGLDQLGQGDTIIKVHYASLNYKDMLATQPGAGVVRSYPMIPGIDLAGEVVESQSGHFQVGQLVVGIGASIGVSHTGGLSQYARLPHEWVLPLPDSISPQDAMKVGTAGLTALLSVLKLEKAGMSAETDPKILVTGASGGVGSVALSILKAKGYQQRLALTRKDYQDSFVRELGATDIVKPDQIFLKEKPILLKGVYDYVLDTVGGKVASHLLAQIAYDGAMSLCGNAGGLEVNTTVMPFILRAVSAIGVDITQVPRDLYQTLWGIYAQELRSVIDSIAYDEVTLDQVLEIIDKLKNGDHLGRTIVKIA